VQTRNLGFSLAEGLAQRLGPTDTVYLTGRDSARVAESLHRLSNARAEVRGELLDGRQAPAQSNVSQT